MPFFEMKTGVVLLAAGQGTRFGGNKLTARFRGRPLWVWAAETAESFDFTERVLVIGPETPIGSRQTWKRVKNRQAERGMGTSIAAGVRALTDSDRVLVMLADMPLVSRAHIGRLLATQSVAFTQYHGGKAGCPAIFPHSVFFQLTSLSGDQGARSIDWEDFELIRPLGENELADIDTTCDLTQLDSAV
ncbi:nucleotidyltransferase family protein [Qipengyuania sp. G39]|uniref:Nucleotidyltransferase family protein n=1 Tax=Qipengyuania profundimaris TaxID=3067652 RepID=A0ABT9HNW8_9SPHN|nr:nucleotidyltransferase family protein [Qipengyuania sp. G39]MDP4574854.1 nucleotidyltransferase family protein [Qipengyuania sp. G39]